MWEWDARVRWLVGLVLVVLLFGAGVQYGRWQSRKADAGLPRVIAEETGNENDSQGETANTPETVQVHVTGAVMEPGVYILPAGSRVNDAIELAGLLPEADPNALNLAAKLRDEQQIIVPCQGETPYPAGEAALTNTASAGVNTNSRTGDKLNINTANLAELDTLPGIGTVLAQRIIDYRQQQGPFRSIEDLQNVAGIGAKRFAELKELITVK